MPPPQPWNDDFNRSDTPGSGVAVDPLGPNFEVIGYQTYPGDQIYISGNVAKDGYEGMAIWRYPTSTDEMFSEIDVLENHSRNYGPVICGADPTLWPANTPAWDYPCYRTEMEGWRGEIILVRSGSQVASGIPWSYSSATLPFRAHIERTGAVVRVFINGVLNLEWTDPVPLTGRYVGFGNGFGIDSDNWAGGDLNLTPPSSPLLLARSGVALAVRPGVPLRLS